MGFEIFTLSPWLEAFLGSGVFRGFGVWGYGCFVLVDPRPGSCSGADGLSQKVAGHVGMCPRLGSESLKFLFPKPFLQVGCGD